MANEALFGGCRRETCSPQPESVPEALSRVRSAQDPNPFPASHLGHPRMGPKPSPCCYFSKSISSVSRHLSNLVLASNFLGVYCT